MAEVNGSRRWRKSIEAGRAVNETAAEIYVDNGREGTAAIAANWEDGERQRRELEETCKLIINQPLVVTPAEQRTNDERPNNEKTNNDEQTNKQ